MPVKVLITGGNIADCTEACDLIEGIKAEKLIADRGYDTNDIVEAATKAGMQVVIPAQKEPKNKAGI